MKVIPALMAMSMSAIAATSDPGETAVHFLEKVRAKELDLDPGTDTALAPSTSSAKRKEIARRLERMARDLGNDPLEVGAVKLDGDLAGVLVRKISGFDPNRMQVFPIALVKRGEEWAPAPVPASFENSGVGYASELRKRLMTLQDWMLRQQVLDLANLRDQSAEHMRRKIEDSLPASTLRSFNSRQTAGRFLAACETRNLPEIFGLLGGSAKTPPENWPLRVKAAEHAVAAGLEVASPWRLLISEDVLRAIVNQDEDDRSALVSIACLDPAGSGPGATRPRIKLVHLELTKSKEGLWRVNPPAYFLQETEVTDDSTDDDLDSDLLDKLPSKIGETYPAVPRPTADEARRAVIAALQQGKLSDLMRLISLAGDPAVARESCISAAQLWWEFHEPLTLRRAVPLAIREDGENAAATVQSFSARNPDRFNFKVLYFKKNPDGWLWTPGFKPEIEQSFREWTELMAGQWRDSWQDILLQDCQKIANIPKSASPPEEESRKLVEAWLQAINTGDLTTALGLTARLSLPDSRSVLLRNVCYELTGARKTKRTPAIVGVHCRGGWAAVGARIDSEGKPSFPLYPVISTPSGPRILAEIDLSASGQRSRDFLNKTTFERLETFDPGASRELKKLFTEHQSAVSKLKSP